MLSFLQFIGVDEVQGDSAIEPTAPPSKLDQFAVIAMKKAFGLLKYAYYSAVFILVPSVFTRFYLKYDEFPVFAIIFGLFLTSLSLWSYRVASSSDPGYLEWHHFRTHDELRDIDDKNKWSSAYRRKKEEAPQEDPESVKR
jgi:hypothetical protein